MKLREVEQLSTFMSRVDTSGECWVWLGPTNANGYGRGYDPDRMKTRYVHQLSFEIFYGFKPEEVMHTCDNRKCVNPAHLKAGDHTANCRDMAAKGRGNTAKITPDDARYIRATVQFGNGGNVVELANRFGISKWTVRQIAKGQTWKDI